MDSSSHDAFTNAELLDHVAWVQNLARRLVNDPHEAEDLAQESVLAVLRDERTLRSPRRFLTRVARNLAFLGLRRRERRERRENAAARFEAVPSVFEQYERDSTHSLVVEVVQELPAHYREVLLLRYFEDRTPTAIAAMLDVPISTVKTRLARAQARVRERLDRLHGGDGKSWLSALAPLALGRRAPKAAPHLPGLTGAWLVTWLVAGAVVLGALVLALEPGWGGRGTDVERGSPSSVAIAPTGAASAVTPAALPPAGGRVAEARSPAPPAAAIDNGLQPGIRLRGRVLDAESRAVPGVVVRMRPYGETGTSSERIAMTDAEGGFSFERFWPGGTIEVAAEEWTNVLVGETASGDPSSEVLVVVAPRRTVRGRVLDETWSPVPGARCEVRLAADHRARFDGALGRSSSVEFASESEGSGRFEIAAPEVAGARLIVRKEGFLSQEIELPESAEGAVAWDVVLERGKATGERLPGRVFLASGRPATGVLVTDGVHACTTDPDGGFELALTGESPRIVAFAPGEGAAVRRRSETGAPWPIPLELRLRAPATARGRVTDARGEGIGGAGIWLVDPTWIGDGGEAAPYLPAARARSRTAERLMAERAEDVPDAVSAADGTFVLEGLLDREYELAAIDPVRLVRGTGRVHPAGDAASVVMLDFGNVVDAVQGRVVDFHGLPVGGVNVRFGTRPGEPRDALGRDAVYSEAVKTDGDGSFILRGVPRADAFLEAVRTGFLRSETPYDGRTRVTLVVERALRLRVEWDAPGTGRRFSVLDETGRPLPMHGFRGLEGWVATAAVLHRGRSEVVRVSDRAARVVVRSGTAVLAEGRIEPLEGEVSVVRLRASR